MSPHITTISSCSLQGNLDQNYQVNEEEENVLRCVVGTLDLSLRYLSHGQTFPGEQVKAPFFCLIDRKGLSRYGYIANLCVAKSARRQGIASRMMQFAIMSAKKQGAEQVFVHVHRHNTPAQRLYQKMGFEVIEAANSQLSEGETYLLHREISTTKL
ncbi:N-alpha-acetyltransferase 50-like isoform X2 [Olea europaea var. sylvestris]|uniref:N-alpha-acetyltransferase 50-like isoform X2 n=1 Tax=Olea europaea var. sylvestris TaxID=158386 RepID=UPI000C1D6E46|nr:N-alpha-acetyltransferase 50-like isoform X2 [Olea europaea var. sylvestris]